MDRLSPFYYLRIMMVFFAILSLYPVLSAEMYNIEIAPTTVSSNEQVEVILEQIPQTSIINMTIEGQAEAQKGIETTFLITDFLFPYNDKAAVFETEMTNLVPGTEATSSVIREDGTEASYTGEVDANGRFNSSIVHEINRGLYNVSFVGTPNGDFIRTNVDFGSSTKEENMTAASGTAESSFILSGFSNGEVDVSIFIDGVLQKTQKIIVSE